jgi:hypothetical protein
MNPVEEKIVSWVVSFAPVSGSDAASSALMKVFSPVSLPKVR